MNSFFKYIWLNSRREQIVILIIVIVSFPFYYISLDLPKYIVSDVLQGRSFTNGAETAVLFRFKLALPGWLGGAQFMTFDGFQLDRLWYLNVLAGLFLVLVLTNAGFKYVINMRKGVLGERLLQRLRFDLFSSLLNLSPEGARHVRPSEAATIIKDEVEPIGGFVGDAFVQPVFLGGQAATALLFILVQNLSLGLIAAFVVFLQAVIIPRLRREQLRLGKERQLLSRALAGKVGEVVESLGEIASHGTGDLERRRIASRLEALFSVRYQLYMRKFAVKTLNNLLAQAAPFLFYTIGGYYALTGQLDIGQLVAVLAAYRDLPPPIKDLIDWDQQRLDAEAKFEQVTEQFSLKGEPEAIGLSQPVTADENNARDAEIAIAGLKVVGSNGDRLLDRITLSLPFGEHVALIDKTGDGAATLAQVLGGRITAFNGTVSLSGQLLATLGPTERRRLLAYVGPDAVIFDSTMRDNIIYGLRLGKVDGAFDSGAETIDYSQAGCRNNAELELKLVAVLSVVGLNDFVFRSGLSRPVEADVASDIRLRITELRTRIRTKLDALGVADAIEPYAAGRYIRNATISQNILFGWPIKPALVAESLSHDAFTRHVLDQCGLTAPLTLLGQRVATTMLEIFEGLPSDHILFEQFSFFSAESFPDYRELLRRQEKGDASEGDRVKLLGLAMLYVEPRHRLGLLDDTIESQIMAARQTFRREATPEITQGIAFYDPSTFCATAPLRENLLFGAIAYSAESSRDRIVSAIHEAMSELGMVHHVYSLGLDQLTGHAGRLLFPNARVALILARSLIRLPLILILNDALSTFGQVEATRVLERIQDTMSGRTLIVAGPMLSEATGFDRKVEFEGGEIVSLVDGSTGDQLIHTETPIQALSVATEGDDLKALRTIPIFAGLDTPRLKLLAFTSSRIEFGVGDVLFRQGEDSDAAYVVVSGSADVLIDTASGPVSISQISENMIVGEMGIVTGEPRSATIIARTALTALRLRKEIFLALMAEFPQMSLSVTRLIVNRLQNNVAAVSRHEDRGRPS